MIVVTCFFIRNQLIRNLVLGPLKFNKLLELRKSLLSIYEKPLFTVLGILVILFAIY